MTFEEFKREFEIFSKIDTPEKLAACERQFQQRLVQMEDADYFEPFEDKTNGDDVVAGYEKNLNAIFESYQLAEDQIHFFIQPSFSAERLLIIKKSIDSYEITLVGLEESYWSRFYRDNAVVTGATKLSRGFITKATGDMLFELLERSFRAARKPQIPMWVLDGTKYKLSMIIDGSRKDVSKHSPDGDSKTGKIINVLEAIMEHTLTATLVGAEQNIADNISLCLQGQ